MGGKNCLRNLLSLNFQRSLWQQESKVWTNGEQHTMSGSGMYIKSNITLANLKGDIHCFYLISLVYRSSSFRRLYFKIIRKHFQVGLMRGFILSIVWMQHYTRKTLPPLLHLWSMSLHGSFNVNIKTSFRGNGAHSDIRRHLMLEHLLRSVDSCLAQPWHPPPWLPSALPFITIYGVHVAGRLSFVWFNSFITDFPFV